MSWLSSNKCGANEARHGQRTEELHDLDCSHLRRVALAVKYDVPANAGHTRLLGASAAMASAQYFAHPVEETRLARSRQAGFSHGEGPPRGVRVEEAGGGQGAHATGIIGPASGTPQDVAEAIQPRAREGSCGGKQAGAGQALASGRKRLLAAPRLPVEASVRCAGNPQGVARARAREEIHVQAEALRIAASSPPASGTLRAAPPHVRRHAR